MRYLLIFSFCLVGQVAILTVNAIQRVRDYVGTTINGVEINDSKHN